MNREENLKAVINEEVERMLNRVQVIKDGVEAGKTFEELLNGFQLMKLRRTKVGKMVDLYQFAEIIKIISAKIGFKISSRGWAYQLETFGIIDKSEFDKVTKIINDCRKSGLLPIDFTAEESSRQFKHVFKPETLTTKQKFLKYFKDAKTRHLYHIPDYWVDEKYYIQVLVEKIDLVTLFEPVCEEYRIPIATSKGWGSISQRWEIIKRFKLHEDAGRIPVLLYCGDFDPSGLLISDKLKKNLHDLYGATKWNPYDKLIVNRFGLNYDFIEDNDLTWIENLVTGGGKELKADKAFIVDYIDNYGRRKCEANALVPRPEAARELIKETIEEYLGDESLDRINAKDAVIRRKYLKHLIKIQTEYEIIIHELSDDKDKAKRIETK